MNRIVLIGNGFDLAHGLPTRYEDFINWYWDQRVSEFSKAGGISKDCLCTFEIEPPFTWYGFYGQIISPFGKPKGKDIIESILKGQYGVKMRHSFSPFFQSIIKSIETKGWVDIENEYYSQLTKCTIGSSLNTTVLKDLNNQFRFLKELLIDYLNTVNSSQKSKLEDIWNIIYSPIKQKEVSIGGRHFVEEYINDWMAKDDFVIHEKIERFDLVPSDYIDEIKYYKDNIHSKSIVLDYPRLFMLPDYIMLLNFNYTNTSLLYENMKCCVTTHIHGELQDPYRIIFGYGDELDEKYKQLQALNENECLRNIKSINYLESCNYRSALAFMESAPFQVLVMGHSCGNSDRTLLNTLFEHKNCISIKPYYYLKVDATDNYLDIVQNISRNFTDMKLMRDRVVNKTYCEPLPQANS